MLHQDGVDDEVKAGSQLGHRVLVRTAYPAKWACGMRPLRASTTERSMSARPMPPIMRSDQLISSTVTSTVPGTSKRSAPESTFPRRTMPGAGIVSPSCR